MEAATEAIEAPEGGLRHERPVDASLASMLATVYAYSYLFRREQAIAGSPRPHQGYVR